MMSGSWQAAWIGSTSRRSGTRRRTTRSVRSGTARLIAGACHHRSPQANHRHSTHEATMALIHNIVGPPTAERVLLLVHGYGADERDLGGVLPYLDPEGRFLAVLPRGPVAAPPEMGGAS